MATPTINHPWVANEALEALSTGLAQPSDIHISQTINRTAEDLLDLIEDLNQMVGVLMVASGNKGLLQLASGQLDPEARHVIDSLEEYASLALKLKSLSL